MRENDDFLKESEDAYEDLIYKVLKNEPNGLRFKELWNRLKGKMAIATLSKTLKKLEVERKVSRIPIRGKKEIRYVLEDREWICSHFIAMWIFEGAVKLTKEVKKELLDRGLNPTIYQWGVILFNFHAICRYYRNDPVKAFDVWSKLFKILYGGFSVTPLPQKEEEVMKGIERAVNECKDKTIADFIKERNRIQKEILKIVSEE